MRTLSDKILFDIYNLRSLTIGQIKSLYYKDKSIDSCYKQLYRMKSNGLIDSQALTSESTGLKESSCYHITTKGINRLVKIGAVENARRAFDNKPKKEQLELVVDANELYVQLYQSGYKFVGSREWKREHSINFNSYVCGGLVTKDGKEYAVYILNSKPKDHTLELIKREIVKEKQTGRFMIFSKGRNTYIDFVKKLTESELSKIEYCVLPFNFIALRLPLFAEATHFVNLLTSYGEVSENITEMDTSSFADYILTMNGQEYYVCNYLLLDEAGLNRAKKYPRYEYENSGRKVAIFCWKELQHRVTGIDNIEFIELVPVDFMEKFQKHPQFEEIIRRQETLDFRHPYME